MICSVSYSIFLLLRHLCNPKDFTLHLRESAKPKPHRKHLLGPMVYRRSLKVVVFISKERPQDLIDLIIKRSMSGIYAVNLSGVLWGMQQLCSRNAFLLQFPGVAVALLRRLQHKQLIGNKDLVQATHCFYNIAE